MAFSGEVLELVGAELDAANAALGGEPVEPRIA